MASKDDTDPLCLFSCYFLSLFETCREDQRSENELWKIYDSREREVIRREKKKK